MSKRLVHAIGGAGIILCVVVFSLQPSFPTPDKLFVVLTFVAMFLGRTKEYLKHFVPFVLLLLVYESFRGFVPYLNTHVNFLWMPEVDRLFFFGHLPTELLQNWLWHGYVQWYDFVFYGAYTLHFVLPFALAVLVWLKTDKDYWRVVGSFLIVSFAAFATFLAFPAAPPWMAADMKLIEPITRVSSHVWAAFGIHDFPSVYNKISPNPVAAVPSLHAAYAFLVALHVTTLFKPKNLARTPRPTKTAHPALFASFLPKTIPFRYAFNHKTAENSLTDTALSGNQGFGPGSKWRLLIWIYPALIWVGTIYQGEHYAIDALIGIMYGVAAYFAAPYVVSWLHTSYKRVKLAIR